MILTTLLGQEALASWSLLGHTAEVTPVKLAMGILILGFSLFELVPAMRALRAPVRWLPVGGALSLGLSPPAFVSSQAVLALLVDGGGGIAGVGDLPEAGGRANEEH